MARFLARFNRVPEVTARRLALPVAFALAAAAAPARAQSDSAARADSVQRRNDCRLAAQVLSTGAPAPRHARALAVIPTCGGEAPAAVAAAWGRAPDDTAALNDLVIASVALLDARTFDAATAAAGDAARPRAVRLAALRTLATYAEPGVLVSFADLTTPAAALTSRSVGRIDHWTTEFGTQPPPADARARVLALARALAERGDDPEVAAGAGFVAATIRP